MGTLLRSRLLLGLVAALVLAALTTAFSMAAIGTGERKSRLGVTGERTTPFRLQVHKRANTRRARLGVGLAGARVAAPRTLIPNPPATPPGISTPALDPGPGRAETPTGRAVDSPAAKRSPPVQGLAAPPPSEPTPLPPPEPTPPPASEPGPSPAPEPSPSPSPEPSPTPTPEPSPTPAPEPAPAPAPFPSAGALTMGIDGGYDEWWPQEVEFRTALGALVTRHEWDPTAEAVDAQDALVLQAVTGVHTRIHALIGGNQLGDPTHYREWVVAFIRRYGQGGAFWSEHPSLDASHYAITTFELGNEPYFGTMTASEYADAVRPALEGVDQLGLPAKLILDSYIYDEDTHWIDTLYQRIPNLNSLFYAFADHPYWYGHDPAETGDGNSPFTRIDTLRRKMAEHGAAAKPIFLTEYGESTANCGGECVSESVQAEHIQQMIDAAAARAEWRVELLSLYQLHDWATSSADRELQFGILREDGTPKAAYTVARAAVQRYRG